jgi:oxygen-independent coproporphyrinogen-3 oxidase
LAGIYLHIPFCKTRCVYCDFYSITNEELINSFVDAICIELKNRKTEINEPAKTIYFGGGTPTRLNKQHFEKIFNSLDDHYNVETDAEITIEANPDDLSEKYINDLSSLPFNRISIGIQSFNDNELKFLSRRHSAKQAADAVNNCQKAEFKDISIDLMYGLPGQTMQIWKDNLKQACSLDIQHISAYHLIYEEKTRLYTLLRAGKVSPVNEDLSNEMFQTLIDTLTENHFIHYEISNFAKDGFYSRHNSSYWSGDPYIGVGPAAHSFDGDNRTWNIASLSKYISAVNTGNMVRETEHLSLEQKYNEAILTGLRTMWGVDLNGLKTKFGNNLYQYCVNNAQKFIEENLLKIEDGNLKLTQKGIFISDGIMSELMNV